MRITIIHRVSGIGSVGSSQFSFKLQCMTFGLENFDSYYRIAFDISLLIKSKKCGKLCDCNICGNIYIIFYIEPNAI